MRLIPSSFNGFLFQQSNRVNSCFLNPYSWNIQGITTGNIPLSQRFPQFATKNYSGAIKVISVTFNDVDLDRDPLVIAMDVFGGTQHQLYALDELGRSWYVNAVCVGLNEEEVSGNTATFGAVFEVDDPVFKKRDEVTQAISTQAIAVNGTGTGTITPIGNQPALPTITISPVSAGTYGFSYQRYVQVIGGGFLNGGLNNYPLEITNGGLDTATLIGGGKMLASGDDLRVYVDGAEVKRWTKDFNSASTKIWINYPNSVVGLTASLAGSILGSGAVTTISLNGALIDTGGVIIPQKGAVKIGSEIFSYTSRSANGAFPFYLFGCTRATRLTTAAAHSSSAGVSWLQHDIWLYYGFPAIDAYVVDDTNKPIIDLSSTNTSWIYGEFATLTNTRTGNWISAGFNLYNLSRLYTGTQNTDDDPVSAMGVAIIDSAYQFFASGTWSLSHPAGMTDITVTGKKRTSSLSVAYNVFLIQSGHAVPAIWTESPPSTPNVWEALDTHSSVALPSNCFQISFYAYAAGTTPPHSIYHEIDTVTIGLDWVPTVSMSAEVGTDVNIHTVISNAATGYDMTIDLVMASSDILTINTQDKTITLSNGSNQINSLIGMPIRAEWFPLLPSQANVISITEDSQIDVGFSWEDRLM